MHARHGELLPNGFHVGDLVEYHSSGSRRYAVAVPVPERWTRQGSGASARMLGPEAKWGLWRDSEEAALRAYRTYDPEAQRESYTTLEATLIRRFDQPEGSAHPAPAPEEGSTTMSVNFHGETITEDMHAVNIVAGQEYRLIYPRPHHNMELIGRAEENVSNSRSHDNTVGFTVVAWPHPTDTYNATMYPEGYSWRAAVDNATEERYSQVFVVPVGATPAPEEVATDSNYSGEPGTFVSHDGHMPEPGTVVRAMADSGTSRQYEGLFLRLNEGGTRSARIEVKRRRDKRANGTFTSWVDFANRTQRDVRVEGAEIFKPGTAAVPMEFVRGAVITTRGQSQAVQVGDIISGHERGSLRDRHYTLYRGAMVRDVNDGYGEWIITATHTASVRQYSTSGAVEWTEMEAPAEKHIIAQWGDGREGYDNAGYTWTVTGGNAAVKRVDPAFDPNRKTVHTGLKIGDLVVGLRPEGGRDTVSSWVKGTIHKWDTRYGRPIIKVTDPMESDRTVDQEVTVREDDVYPALADPKGADPEEFKKTLRLYLIGRHKRGDFCRGGLNTMLAAFGVPLYETRRRAQMVVAVDYDPNATDLYTVQQQLRSQMPGVSGLSFEERSGEEIELTLESDVTTG